MTEKFILVNLKEEKSKKLAEVISNKTSRKILDYLSEKEASETEISKALNLPISTAHYNIQSLLDNGLIKTDEFYWSKKGNKINIYAIAKKLIIIAPKGSESIKNKLKSIIPVALISIAAAGLIRLFSSDIFKKLPLLLEKEVQYSYSMGEDTLATSALEVINVVPNYALWFLFGAIFAIIVYLVWNWRK